MVGFPSFYGWIIAHRVYVPQRFYSLIYWWALGVLSCLRCGLWPWDGHGCIHSFIVFWVSSDKYPEVGSLNHKAVKFIVKQAILDIKRLSEMSFKTYRNINNIKCILKSSIMTRHKFITPYKSEVGSDKIAAWLVWLSGLSVGLQTRGSPVWFHVRAHAWVAGQGPSIGCVRGNQALMFSLALSPSLPLSKNK